MATPPAPAPHAPIPEIERLPVSLITGFLGSGKTTLLNQLLRHPDLADTAVIVNEFGEIGLDHELIESSSEDMVLMNSGCLCCTIRGDLVTTLRGLFLKRVRGEVPRFRRVVIETTGLADPAPILHTLMTDPLASARFRLDGVITTIDAVNGGDTLDRQEESLKQAAVADRLVLTKTDLPEASALTGLTARLRALNPAAPILETAPGRPVDPAALFNAGLYDPATKTADVRRWLKAEAYADDHSGHEHEHGHDHGRHAHDINRHDDRIRAFCVTYDRPLPEEVVETWLQSLMLLRGPDVLRVKGIVHVAGIAGPVVIHAVQHIFHPPALLETWPSDDRRTRIVFITRDIGREVLEESLRSFDDASRAAAPQFQPDRAGAAQ